ncbi:MAG: VOC family protein [Saprospiraceae bacterium]|nr:VOC family protein [Lewinella sp.]
MATIQKITPYLWFDDQALEAATYYTDIFPDSRIIQTTSLITEFELYGLKMVALNGGPRFNFTEAVSFLVSCKDQAEVDYFWDKLTAATGDEGRCGWLKDRYGLSWQIVPERFLALMGKGDGQRIQKMMQAMMPMNKLIMAELEAAYYS